MSKKDTDDVLDFINSLPDSKSNTPAQKKKTTESSSEFLDFLDELNAHEKSPRPAGASRAKFEPKRKDEVKVKENVEKKSRETEARVVQPDAGVAEVDHGVVPTKVESQSETTGSETSGGDTGADVSKEDAEEENVIDPIASISSWWNTEGSNKVSSLWGSLTSNAHQLSEQTYQLASNTSQQLSHQRQKLIQEHSGVAEGEHILNITDKLNSILTTMSEQIKDGLIDKEDELLNILLVYDLNNVAYLDRLCAQKFNKVMGQVEGGIKVTVNNFNHKHENVTLAREYYDLGMFYGKAIDGEKLCFANLESSIRDYLKITGAADDAAETQESKASETRSDKEHVINKSNVFIAIQPISTGSLESTEEASGPSLIEAGNSNSFAFTMILKDISNNITIVSKSQPFPLRWARWVAGERGDVEAIFGVPEEGEEAVDPSEWVKDWLKDGLALSFGVLAQEYVTKRMGM
ncbi:CIC11C00000001317 [Sungouiella intermedia]|uniref:CIC11C00000001317 n=1 Tax=Sungouiella intermedia TaxID=45354 RepID=A0A1L0BYS9_9ASCO|nr:CIC11C00000001317 [[Candida] intermedia]